MIYIITTERDETVVHRVIVESGQYLAPKKVIGSFSDRASVILNYINSERPEKVIVEEVAFGKATLVEILTKMLNHGLVLENDGTVNYNVRRV